MPTTESPTGVTFIPGADAQALQQACVDFVLALMDGTLSDATVKWVGVTAVFQAYEAVGTFDGNALRVAVARLQKIMAPTPK